MKKQQSEIHEDYMRVMKIIKEVRKAFGLKVLTKDVIEKLEQEIMFVMTEAYSRLSELNYKVAIDLVKHPYDGLSYRTILDTINEFAFPEFEKKNIRLIGFDTLFPSTIVDDCGYDDNPIEHPGFITFSIRYQDLIKEEDYDYFPDLEYTHDILYESIIDVIKELINVNMKEDDVELKKDELAEFFEGADLSIEQMGIIEKNIRKKLGVIESKNVDRKEQMLNDSSKHKSRRGRC
jgi:hypothetical protein